MNRAPGHIRLALLCSTRCPATTVVQSLDVAVALVAASGAIISGFQSAIERECLRILLAGTVLLVVCPARSAIDMRIPAAWKGPMADGRLTIRAFIDEVASTRRGQISRPSRAPRRPTIALAEQRNRFVAAISDAVLILHASPGEKLDRLATDLLTEGRKRVWTLDDPANAHLIARGARPVRPQNVAAIWKGQVEVD